MNFISVASVILPWVLVESISGGIDGSIVTLRLGGFSALSLSSEGTKDDEPTDFVVRAAGGDGDRS